MRVVFALPPYDYSRSIGNTRKRAQIGLLPPLGVGYLAAAVEQHGHEAFLVDAIAEQLNVPQTVEAIAVHRPDVIGISSFTTLTPNTAYALAAALKRLLPKALIVMGGPHVTSFARQIPDECPDVDILVPGDGEPAMVDILERIQNGKDWRDIQGILYRNECEQTTATPPRPPTMNIDAFPHPARHIYKNELYQPLPSLSARRPATSMITARGCPWAKCRFCYQGGEYATPYRRRSPENVVDEMSRLVQDYGIRNIVFWDDNFCAMPGWIDSFCDLLDKARLDIIWSVLARTNTVTQPMLKRMAASGCYSIQYGVESGNQQILDMINKGHTLEQCRNAVRWAKAAGMDTRAFFVLGFPTETPEMSDETIRFACELNVDYVVFFSYHVAPGTPLAEIAAKEGICGDYIGQHLPSYIPNTYADVKQLEEKVISAYRRYYLRPAYISRALWRAVKHPSLLKNHFLGFYYWLGLMLAPQSREGVSTK